MKLKILIISAIILLFSVLSFAQTGGGKAVRVKFKKGANSAVYTGTVSHSSDAYYLSARRGQTMTIRISGNGEPAFHVGTVAKGSQNSDSYKPISEDDLKTYTFKINTDDNIAVLVGGVRGSSSYKITITIK